MKYWLWVGVGTECCLSEQDEPITDLEMLLARSAYFSLSRNDALAVLAEVYVAVMDWRQVALVGAAVGLRSNELGDFAPAFEHKQMSLAKAVLG